jgi:hypothetical protein
MVVSLVIFMERFLHLSNVHPRNNVPEHSD